MSYQLQQIASVLSAPVKPVDAVIDTLLIDSRKWANAPTTLFFALDGPRRNGHLFIEELYKKGLRYFVISQNINEGQYPHAVFLKVTDTLQALQRLAAFHRSHFTMNIIGITGSNGKTVVKEWLYQLLQADKKIVRSPKSYNSQIGVPLSVWQMSASDDLAIFEAGISLPGEMERLQKIIQPDIGILTNIGAAHREGFTGDEQKLQEKLKLFAGSKVVVTNGDNELVNKNLHHLPVPVFRWGYTISNELRITGIHKHQRRTSISLLYDATGFVIIIPFTDAASIENAITCCAVLLYLGIAPSTIIERISNLHAVNMRMEFKKGINNTIIINDSYSADVNSLSIALDFLQQQAKGDRKTVILSDFAENTENDTAFYTRIVALLRQHGVQRLIGIGPKMQSLLPGILHKSNNSIRTELYSSTQDFSQRFQSQRFKEEVILIKGARMFKFENIVALLEQKVHQTILEIDMDSIAYNYRSFQELLLPQTKIMVMVKAFAYGSGGAEIAGLLQYHKADYLGVAYADEGVELRKAGISVPVMVLNAEPLAFDAITEYQLEPDIFSFNLLDAFTQHLRNEGIKNYPIHIEVETGMNRLGFSTADVERLGIALQNNQHVKVVSVFSHLVASDDTTEDNFSMHQYHLLSDAANILQNKVGYAFLRHIANSSAIARLPQLQMDMVRLGIGLYGVGATGNNMKLQPALTLKSTIAQVKHLKAGETVSYNRKGVAHQDSIIATVRIGYADGYSRRLGNGVGQMLVNGYIAPVIGTVCMDMTMIDITNIPHVQEGDEVIVFGRQPGIESIAQAVGTIPYEIMTGISQRVKRVYYRA